MTKGQRTASIVQNMISLSSSMIGGQTSYNFNPLEQLKQYERELAAFIDEREGK